MNIPSRANFVDLTGRKDLGSLEVVSFAGFRRYGNGNRAFWTCRCVCGTVKDYVGYALCGGGTTSCGCVKFSKLLTLSTTHGKTGTPEYHSWARMIQRCTNTNDAAFSRYGGRGIQVCERWRNSFELFLADMGTRPSPKHSIDRFPDNDGNYEPGNCRWATDKEQNRNKRSTVLLTLNGVTKGLSDWAEEIGVNRSSLKTRKDRGWSDEAALTIPFRKLRTKQ